MDYVEAVAGHLDFKEQLRLPIVILPDILLRALNNTIRLLAYHVFALVDAKPLRIEKLGFVVKQAVRLFAPRDRFDQEFELVLGFVVLVWRQ